MYISGRPYEHRFAALRNSDPNNISNSDLHMMERLVKMNFLSAYIVGQINVQEYRDAPKLTQASFISQMGAAMNLWVGLTVVVFIEIIEFFYEAISRKCETKNTGTQWYIVLNKCWRNKFQLRHKQVREGVNSTFLLQFLFIEQIYCDIFKYGALKY